MMAEDHFDSLPDEIVGHIFGQLDDCNLQQMCAVNQRFKTAATAPELWENLFIRNFGFTVPDEDLSLRSHRESFFHYKRNYARWYHGEINETIAYGSSLCEGTARGISLSPDGKIVAAVTHGRKMFFLSTETEQVLREFKGVGYGWGVDYNGTLAVTATGDGVLRGFNVDTPQELFTINGHAQSDTTAMSVHLRDADNVASGGGDGTLSLYDLRSLQRTSNRKIHKMEINTVLMTDTEVYSGSDDKEIHIFDLRADKIRQTLTGHEGWVKRVRKQGNILYSCGDDNLIYRWDVAAGQSHRIKIGSWAFDMAVDDYKVLVGSQSGLLYVLDAHNLEVKREEQLAEKGQWVCALAARGNLLCTGTKQSVNCYRLSRNDDTLPQASSSRK